MIDYIKNYPWRYYLKNAFRRTTPGSLVFWLRGTEKATALVLGETISFMPDLQEHSVSLPFGTAGAETDSSILGAGKRFQFLCDIPEAEVRLISTESLDISTPQQLFETPLHTLFPAMENAGEYAWEFLSPDFSVVTDTLPASVLLVGIPAKFCDHVEHWTLAMSGSAIGFEPWLLSVLRWCGSRTKSFLLLPGVDQSRLAVFRDGNLLLLERLPGFQGLFEAPDKLANRIADLGLGLELEGVTLEIYRGEIPPLKAKEFIGRLGCPANILEASESEKAQIETQGARVSTDACVMADTIRCDDELFVSAEHRDATLYRTHSLYWGTFYVLAALIVIQLAVFGIFVFQQSASAKLAAISEQAAADAAKMEGEEAKLAPLIYRIRSVAPWSNFLQQKEPISRLLSRIEASVPPEVCLTAITVTNHVSEPMAPDRLTMTVRGWSKGGTNLESAFLTNLRAVLPTFKIAEEAKGDDSSNGSLTSFRLEITQK